MKRKLFKVLLATLFAGVSATALVALGACDGCGGHDHVDDDYNSVCDVCGEKVVAFKLDDATNGMVTSDKEVYEVGDIAILTLSSISGYKLESLTVNGVDKASAVQDGKLEYTITENDKVLAVRVVFVKPVTLQSSVNNDEYGSVTFDKAKYNVGDGMTVTCVPSEGYGVQCIKINGEDVTDSLESNVYIVKSVQTENIAVEVDFVSVNAVFDTVFDVDGKWRANGLKITFTRDGETSVEATVEKDACKLTGVKYGLWQASTVINGMPINLGNVMVRSESQFLDLGKMFNDDEVVSDRLSNIDLAHGAFDLLFPSYSNTGYVVTDKTLYTAINAEQGDVFYAMHLSLGDSEKAELLTNEKARYLSIYFNFGEVAKSVNMAFTKSNCLTNWSAFGKEGKALKSEFIQSLINGEGIIVVAQYVAETGNINVYVGNSATKPELHAEYKAELPVNGTVKAIGLGDALGWDGASFKGNIEFSYGKTLDEALSGNVYCTVNDGEAVTGGAVTVNGGGQIARGEEITVKVTPDDDYACVGLTVNGADYFDKLDDDGNLVLGNYFRTQLKIQAEFIKLQTFESVTFKVDEKWGANGLTVTLTRDGETEISGAVENNCFTASNVKAGEWRASAEVAGMKLSLGRVFVTDSEVTVDLANMFNDAAVANRRISGANLKDGTFKYTTEPYQNNEGKVKDTILYFNNLDLPDGGVCFGLSMQYKEFPASTPYFSVYFKTANEAKPITFYFANKSGNFWVEGGSNPRANLNGKTAAVAFQNGAKLNLIFKYNPANGNVDLYIGGEDGVYELACTRELGLEGGIKAIGLGDALGYGGGVITFDLAINCKAALGDILGNVTATVNDGETVTGGTVTVNNGNTINVGESVNIAVTPAQNYILTAFTVNGEDKLSEVGDKGGNYTIDEYLRKTLEIEVQFTEQTALESVTFNVDEKWGANGITVTLKKAGQTDITGTVAENKFTAQNVELGEWQAETQFGDMKVSLGAVNVASYTITLDLGKAFDDATVADRRISSANLNNGTMSYMTEGYENNNHTVSDTIMYFNNADMPAGDAVLGIKLTPNEALPANRAVYISVYFKTAEAEKSITIFFNKSSGNMFVCSSYDTNVNVKSKAGVSGFFNGGSLYFVFKYNSTNGNGEVYLGGADGTSYELVRTCTLGLSGAVQSIGLGDAFGNGGANVKFNMHLNCASSLSDLLGNVTATVNDGEAVTGGTVTVNNGETIAFGSDVNIVVTPAQNHILTAFTVNGENKLSEVDENGGTYKIEGYLGRTLTVNVGFAEKTTFATVTFNVDEKWGANGITVTLKKTGQTDITGTVSENKFTAQNVEMGEWQAYAEIAGMKVSLGTVNIAADTITLDIANIFNDNAVANRRISGATLSAGSFEYTTESYENKNNTVSDTILYFNNADLPQGDMCLELTIKGKNLPSSGATYLSVYFKTATQAKAITLFYAKASGNFFVSLTGDTGTNLKNKVGMSNFFNNGGEIRFIFKYVAASGNIEVYFGGSDGTAYELVRTCALGLSGNIESIGLGDVLGYGGANSTLNLTLDANAALPANDNSD